MYYAGFDEPKDYEKAYRVLMCSNVYNMVLEVVNKPQLHALIKASKSLIEHKRQELIQANVLRMDELISKVERMVAESSEAMEAINSGELQKAVESLVANITAQGADNQADQTHENVNTQPDNIVPIK